MREGSIIYLMRLRDARTESNDGGADETGT